MAQTQGTLEIENVTLASKKVDCIDDVEIRKSADRKTRKKFLSYAVISMFLFLNGVQYVLILPTAYDYIVLQLHGNANIYGFVLGAFSLSGLVANVVFGWLSDGILPIKVSATICNVFLLVGSFMYFTGINAWFVMLSRLISGVGTGAGASYWADLARNTSEREKTRIFAIVMMFRQLGIIVGPAVNLLFHGIFLETREYVFGPFKLNSGSMPGLFMAFVWLLMIFFCLFCYTDLESLLDNKPCPRRPSPSENKSNNGAPTQMDVEAKPQENSQLIEHQTSDSNFRPTIQNYFSALGKADVLCLQFVLFITCFIQTAIETSLAPMTYLYVEWGEHETSLWFLASGVFTVFIFILVSGPLTQMFHDFSMSAFGIFCELCSFPFLIAMAYLCNTCCNHFLGRLAPNHPAALGLLLTGLIVNTIGLPFIVACTVSLFSNVVPRQYQGMAHGIRRSLSFLGFLLGPIWGGAYIPHLSTNFVAFFSMYAIVFLMLLASKSSLYR